jgi:hypothetical protein
MKSEMKYVFVKLDSEGHKTISIIDNPTSLFKSGAYSEQRGDKLFQLGNEVTIEVQVVPLPASRKTALPNLTYSGIGTTTTLPSISNKNPLGTTLCASCKQQVTSLCDNSDQCINYTHEY